MQVYSGGSYIWTLAQTARAKQMFSQANYPATWQGIEALQRAVAMTGERVPKAGPWDMRWARAAFSDAEARFHFKYEQVVA